MWRRDPDPIARGPRRWQSAGFAGNGFDFSSVTAINDYVEIPASVAGDIWGADAGATATAAITGSAVSSLSLTAGGTLYTGGALVVITGGGGTGATGTATVVAGVVTALNLTAGGTGYTSAPTVTIVPNAQQFLACCYVKLPTTANWMTATNYALPFLGWATSAAGYSGGSDLVQISQSNFGSLQRVHLARQVNGSSVGDVVLVPNAADFGSVVQLAMWRNAAGVGVRIRSANGIVAGTSTVTAPNIGNFSGLTGKAGIGPANWANAIGTGAKNWRLYRGFIENLLTSGRDPVAVLDADYARVAARGVFS